MKPLWKLTALAALAISQSSPALADAACAAHAAAATIFDTVAFTFVIQTHAVPQN